MNAELQPTSDPAQLKPLYNVALLESQVVAQQALQRLESLCRRYPDPALHDAIEALRREENDTA